MRQDPETGFLLSDQKVQTIIPLSKMAESGYMVRWGRQGREISHIKHGSLPVQMIQGCPTLDAELGEQLLKELEEEGRRKAKIRSIMADGIIAGGDQSPWKRLEDGKVVVICLDILTGANLLDGHLSGWLEALARSGKVDMFLAGPPCRSVSVSRHREDGGPRPVRGRE